MQLSIGMLRIMTKVHTAFSHLTGAEAVAFSEPLCRTDEFQMYHEGQFEDIYRPLGGVAAIGAVHSNGENTYFNFALRTNNHRPLATTEAFARVYNERISGLRGRALHDPYAIHVGDHAKQVIMKEARLYGLQTIVALLLFRAAEDASAHTSMLIVPRSVMADAGATIDGSNTRAKNQHDKKTSVNTYKELGFLAGIAQMPPLSGVKDVLDAHPDIAGFLRLKRGPKRGRLKAEAREARKTVESKK